MSGQRFGCSPCREFRLRLPAFGLGLLQRRRGGIETKLRRAAPQVT